MVIPKLAKTARSETDLIISSDRSSRVIIPDSKGMSMRIISVIFLHNKNEQNEQQDAGYHGKKVKTHISLLQFSKQAACF
jgi:hypothetical protein